MVSDPGLPFLLGEGHRVPLNEVSFPVSPSSSYWTSRLAPAFWTLFHSSFGPGFLHSVHQVTAFLSPSIINQTGSSDWLFNLPRSKSIVLNCNPAFFCLLSPCPFLLTLSQPWGSLGDWGHNEVIAVSRPLNTFVPLGLCLSPIITQPFFIRHSGSPLCSHPLILIYSIFISLHFHSCPQSNVSSMNTRTLCLPCHCTSSTYHSTWSIQGTH